MLNILHVAEINNNKYSGLAVAVPEHIRHQASCANVKFVNCNGISIDGLAEWQVNVAASIDLIDYLATKNFRPNLVVIHGVNYIRYIKIYQILLKHKIPYIIVPHGELTANALRKKWLKKKVAYLLFFNKFINNSLAIQALSKNEQKSINIKQTIFVASNGVCVPNLIKEKYSNYSCNLIYIGRLEVLIKGIDLLIQAIDKLKAEELFRELHLDIFGPDTNGRGDEIRHLIINRNLEDKIILHPPISGEKKAKKLIESDIFIQTSRTEGMPLGILEALSYGLPCILTKGTNLDKDILDYNAGYNAGSDANTIAEAIKSMYSSREEWPKYGENARKLINEKYLWSSIAETTIKKYEELISFDRN